MLALAGATLSSILISISNAQASSTVNYSYDPLGRIITASYPDGTCTTYVYDAAGNRSQYTSGSATGPTNNTVALTDYEDVATKLDPRINNPSCAALTIASVGSPSHGSASVASGGGYITYTPATGYTGADSFSYTISSSVGSATGTVNVTVIAPTLAPIANTGTIRYFRVIPPPPAVTPTGTLTPSSVASDPYGYSLTFTGVTQGASGSVSFNASSLQYTYNSSVNYNLFTSDSFTYTVSDGHGRTSTGIINVNINVNTTE